MENPVKEKIAQITTNIRVIRLAKGYSQQYMAMKLRISQNAYSKIELGYTKLGLRRFIQIADILGTQATDIINIK